MSPAPDAVASGRDGDRAVCQLSREHGGLRRFVGASGAAVFARDCASRASPRIPRGTGDGRCRTCRTFRTSRTRRTRRTRRPHRTHRTSHLSHHRTYRPHRTYPTYRTRPPHPAHPVFLTHLTRLALALHL